MSRIEVYCEREERYYSIPADLTPGYHTFIIDSRKYAMSLLENYQIRYIFEIYNDEAGFIDERYFKICATLGDRCCVCISPDDHQVCLVTSEGREVCNIEMHDSTTSIKGMVVSSDEKRIALFVDMVIEEECPPCEQYKIYVYDFEGLFNYKSEIFNASVTEFLGGIGPFFPDSFSMCFTVDNILLVMVNWRVRLYLPCGSIICVPDAAMPWLRRMEAMSELELRNLECICPDMSLDLTGRVVLSAFGKDYFFVTVTEREFVCDEL